MRVQASGRRCPFTLDVVQVLTQQADDLTARKYWNQLKRRLNKEGSQLVTSCHQLKMPAADGNCTVNKHCKFNVYY